MKKISNKIIHTKVLINIVVLILIYYFSFHMYPKIGFYNTLEYKGIETKAFSFYSDLHRSYFDHEISVSEEPEFLKEQELFLKKYLYYFTQNKDLVSNAPCPKELLVNNLRNIQIISPKNLLFQEDLKFNVRFSFYKYFSLSKLDINKCFDYIFKENLNKYFILYRDRLIEKIRFETDLLRKIELDYSKIILEYDKIQFRLIISEEKIKSLKNYNFFIDPNVNYLPEQLEDKSWPKIIAFGICLLIFIFTNILYQKLNRKQVSKFINKFMNT